MATFGISESFAKRVIDAREAVVVFAAKPGGRRPFRVEFPELTGKVAKKAFYLLFDRYYKYDCIFYDGREFFFVKPR